MIVSGSILSILALAMSVPCFVLATEVAASIRYRHLPKVRAKDGPCLAVLIPAHNEASGIETTLLSVKSQLRASDRMIVVADNCSDETASIAESLGAEVVVRMNDAQRGKGYALDAGVRYLSANPPGFVAVIDADCFVSDGCLDELVSACSAAAGPVQGTNLMRSVDGRLPTRVSEFAWRVRNLVRPSGGAVLGFPALLLGTGMIFRWDHIVTARLASSSIVEDMELGIQFTLSEKPPRFVRSPPVVSGFPIHASDQKAQRRRWEHGHLATLLRFVPRLAKTTIVNCDLDTLKLAFVLSVPPIALQAVLQTLLTGSSAILLLLAGTHFLPAFVISALGLATLILALGLAWHHAGRDLLRPSEVLFFPLYIAKKLNVYSSFLLSRQTKWNRARRDGE